MPEAAVDEDSELVSGERDVDRASVVPRHTHNDAETTPPASATSAGAGLRASCPDDELQTCGGRSLRSASRGGSLRDGDRAVPASVVIVQSDE